MQQGINARLVGHSPKAEKRTRGITEGKRVNSMGKGKHLVLSFRLEPLNSREFHTTGLSLRKRTPCQPQRRATRNRDDRSDRTKHIQRTHTASATDPCPSNTKRHACAYLNSTISSQRGTRTTHARAGFPLHNTQRWLVRRGLNGLGH